MRRALPSDEKRLGPDHAVLAIRLNGLGGCCCNDTRHPAEAEPLIRARWPSTRRVHGPDHPSSPSVSTVWRTSCRIPTGSRGRAFHAASADYDPREKPGPNSPNVARDLSNLAELLQDTNRLPDAEPLHRRALAIDEECPGPDHPSVAGDLNNLALLLQKTNRLTDAEPLMRRACAIFTARLRPDHPTTKTVAENYRLLLEAGAPAFLLQGKKTG